MPRVTILGAGITGMAIACQLPKDYSITIYGRHLPGDDLDPEYVSQWAGAIWLGVHDSSDRDQKFQLSTLPYLFRIAQRHPESSVRITELTEICDTGSESDVWYQDKVPGFRFLDSKDLPAGAKFGMKWTTVVLTPVIFLPWLRGRLEAVGVAFKRAHVSSLSDMRGLEHDVLINASGFGSVKLLDVNDSKIIPIRQQNLRIRKPGYNSLYLRRGDNFYYSTAFGRGDETIYIGGVKTEKSYDFEPKDDQRNLIMQRAHDNNPQLFPSADPSDYDVICDHVGVYPIIKRQNGGVRVEKEIIGGQRVIHVYGQEAGGYTYSFGLGQAVASLVTEYLSEIPRQSKI